MRLLDWLLGRGSNPLEREQTPMPSTRHVRVPPQDLARQVEEQRARLDTSVQDVHDFAAEADELVQQQARTLGVDVPVLLEMLEQRELFVAKVEAEPRTWGFDLAPAHALRRDAAAEYRQATRLTGTLGESFLSGYEPLMAAAPDPLTLPSGTPLPEYLQEEAGVSAEVARDIAQHIRTTIQATLGRPLEAEAVERAVREASWDHDFDAAPVLERVLRALEDEF